MEFDTEDQVLFFFTIFDVETFLRPKSSKKLENYFWNDGTKLENYFWNNGAKLENIIFKDGAKLENYFENQKQ